MTILKLGGIGAALVLSLLPGLAFADASAPSDPTQEDAFLDVLPKLEVPSDVQPIPGAVNEAFRNCRASWPAEYETSQKGPEARAYAVAGGGLAIGLMGMIAVVTLLPLKQTEAFLAVVDKDTGVAERVVAVEKAGIEQAEAIRQSLLFAYVTDRETYDQHDNEKRILRAYTWSEGAAKDSLVTLWTEGHPNYPPKLYGESSKVLVDILSITPVTDATAQVRFTKTWVSDGEGIPDREGKFTATVTYRFEPSKQTALDLVWQNPTGFLVTDYRITAETIAPKED